jgi:hypothetical protein
VFLNSNLGLSGNEVLFLADREPPDFSSITSAGTFWASPGGLSSAHIPGILKERSGISGVLPSGA